MMLNSVAPRFDYDKAKTLLNTNPFAAKIYLLKTPIDPAQVAQNHQLLLRSIELGAEFIPVIEHLMNQKLPVNLSDPKTKDTALHYAVRKQNIAAVQLLLSEGAIQLANNEGETPLYDAVRAGNLKLINILLENNKDKDLRLVNKYKQSPLDWLFIEAGGRTSTNRAKNTFKFIITAFIQRNVWPTHNQITNLPTHDAETAEIIQIVAMEALKKNKIALALDCLSNLRSGLKPSQIVLIVMKYGSVEALQTLFARDKKFTEFNKNILNEPANGAARANNVNMLRHIRSKLKMLTVTSSTLEAAVEGDAIDVFCYLEKEFLQNVALTYIDKLLRLAISYQADKVFEYLYKNYVEKCKDQETAKDTLANFKKYSFGQDNLEFLKKYLLIIKQQNIAFDKSQLLIALINAKAIKCITWFLSEHPLASYFPIQDLTSELQYRDINEIQELFIDSLLDQIESSELGDAYLAFLENLIAKQLSVIYQSLEKFAAIVALLNNYRTANKLKIINLYHNQIKVLIIKLLDQDDFQNAYEFDALLVLLSKTADDISVLQIICDLIKKKATNHIANTSIVKKITELYFSSLQNKEQMRAYILATNNVTVFKFLANIAMVIEDKEEIDFWLRQLAGPDSSVNLGLLVAAYGPTSYLAKLMQEGKFSIKEADDAGETALFYATRASNRETVEYLVQRGLSVTQRNKKGQTLLHCVVNNENGIMQYLEKQGLNYDERDLAGKTALDTIISRDASQAVEYLLKNNKIAYPSEEAIITIITNNLFNIIDCLCRRDSRIVIRIAKQAISLDAHKVLAYLWQNKILQQFRANRLDQILNLDEMIAHAVAANASESLLVIWPAIEQQLKQSSVLLRAITARAGSIIILLRKQQKLADTDCIDSVHHFSATNDVKALIFMHENELPMAILNQNRFFKRGDKLVSVILNKNSESALHIAAQANALAAFVYLVSIGLLPDLQDDIGNLPLHYAAEAGSLAILEWYANNNKLNFECKNDADQTIFDVANEASKKFLLPLLLKSNLIKNKEIFKAIVSAAMTIDSLKIILIDCLPKMAEESYQSRQFEQGDAILDYLKQIWSRFYYDTKLELIARYRSECLDEFCLEIIANENPDVSSERENTERIDSIGFLTKRARLIADENTIVISDDLSPDEARLICVQSDENTIVSSDCKNKARSHLIDSLLRGEQLLHDQLYEHLIILYKNNIPNFDEKDTLKYALFHYLRAVQGLYHLSQLEGKKDEQREQKFYLYLTNRTFPKFGDESLSERDWTPEAMMIYSLFYAIESMPEEKRQVIITCQLAPHLNKLTAKSETLSVIISNNSPLHQNSNSAGQVEQNTKPMSGPGQKI